MSTGKLIGIIASAHGKKPSLVNINFDLLNMVAKIIGKKDAFDRLTNNLQVDIEHTKNTGLFMGDIDLVYDILAPSACLGQLCRLQHQKT